MEATQKTRARTLIRVLVANLFLAVAGRSQKNSQAQPGGTTQSHRVDLLRPLHQWP